MHILGDNYKILKSIELKHEASFQQFYKVQNVEFLLLCTGDHIKLINVTNGPEQIEITEVRPIPRAQKTKTKVTIADVQIER